MHSTEHSSGNDTDERRGSVLCVDLDGTLIRTDLFAESLLLLLRRNALYLIAIPFWLFRGRAFLKREIARRVSIDYEQLPYQTDLVAFLREEHGKHRRIVLVTGSDQRYAGGIADHLGFFSQVYASDGNTNLKGAQKAGLLVASFGANGFVYAGNSGADLPVWRQASAAILVGARGSLLDRVGRDVPI